MTLFRVTHHNIQINTQTRSWMYLKSLWAMHVTISLYWEYQMRDISRVLTVSVSTCLLWTCLMRSDRQMSDGSPRVLAEFARSACCVSFPVFGVTGVTVIWLQTCCHHPYRGESGLDLSPFIIWLMAKSTSQCDPPPLSKPRASSLSAYTIVCHVLSSVPSTQTKQETDSAHTPPDQILLLSDWVSLRAGQLAVLAYLAG